MPNLKLSSAASGNIFALREAETLAWSGVLADGGRFVARVVLGDTGRIAIEEGHLKPETHPMHMLFQIHGLILPLHHDARFMRNPGAIERAGRGFERILADSLALPATTPAKKKPR